MFGWHLLALLWPIRSGWCSPASTVDHPRYKVNYKVRPAELHLRGGYRLGGVVHLCNPSLEPSIDRKKPGEFLGDELVSLASQSTRQAEGQKVSPEQ